MDPYFSYFFLPKQRKFPSQHGGYSEKSALIYNGVDIVLYCKAIQPSKGPKDGNNCRKNNSKSVRRQILGSLLAQKFDLTITRPRVFNIQSQDFTHYNLCPMCGRASAFSIEKIKKGQNKILRLITGAPRSYMTNNGQIINTHQNVLSNQLRNKRTSTFQRQDYIGKLLLELVKLEHQWLPFHCLAQL